MALAIDVALGLPLGLLEDGLELEPQAAKVTASTKAATSTMTRQNGLLRDLMVSPFKMPCWWEPLPGGFPSCHLGRFAATSRLNVPHHSLSLRDITDASVIFLVLTPCQEASLDLLLWNSQIRYVCVAK